MAIKIGKISEIIMYLRKKKIELGDIEIQYPDLEKSDDLVEARVRDSALFHGAHTGRHSGGWVVTGDPVPGTPHLTAPEAPVKILDSEV